MTHAPPQPAQPATAARVQAKPMLGRPGDRFEQEADRIADTLTADRPTPLTGPLPVTPLIQRQPDEEEKRKKEDEVQMKSTGGPTATGTAVESAAAAVATGGRPLSRAERGFFEPRFGRDLSAVRLHEGARAGAAARGIGARAYTLGQNIAFAPGEYTPGSPRGRHLMAHELTHTLQQRTAGSASAAAAIETEAERSVGHLAAGMRPEIRHSLAPRSIVRFGQPQHVPDQTFIADPAGDGFLTQADSYHRAWGLNPQAINSIAGIVERLAASTGALSRIRLVTHADRNNLFIRMFEGGTQGVLEPHLRGFAQNQGRGLESYLTTQLLNQSSIDTVVDATRAEHTALMSTFGLGQSGARPQPVIANFLRRTVEHWMFQEGAPDSALSPDEQQTVQTQSATMEQSLRIILNQINLDLLAELERLSVALRTKATEILRFPNGLGLQDPDLISDLAAANTGANAQFYERLTQVRERFSASSTIDLRGCRVGGNASYMSAVGTFFGKNGTNPTVTGPDWWQSFPTLGFRSIPDNEIPTQAANADVMASLRHWFGEMGIQDTFSTDEERLRHFLNQPMVLPVRQRSVAPDAYEFLALHPIRDQAISAWLGGVWSSQAPQLAAMQQAGIMNPANRQVEALTDQDPDGTITEIVISPDSRYAAHIRNT
ncbi:DUF4157 domain-containing protein [Rhodovulum tesquicola]|uniref:eCIS core domain-containing protein n=1 Tax=Rhodovulum tesquicola TaxID=540254 RepID=UPI002096CCBE|nr:DUF4157 domain-containing protein [Rhodovulum tesquicola]MCO8145605.1 DUF4157 domain-containing protein [Rhodovulum tesquicola]